MVSGGQGRIDAKSGTLRIEERLVLGPQAASAARRRLGFLEGRVPPDRLDDVRLLVSELVTNCYRHAGLRTRDVAVLIVEADRNLIRVQVEDAGRGFMGAVPQRLAQDRASGWGLTIVDRMADRWGVIENGSTIVWFELDLGSERRGNVNSLTRKRASGH